MLIAEDLLLLLTDDASGRLMVSGAEVDIALGGANLLELALANRVDLTREGDEARPGRLVVRDATPTGDEVLDRALEVVVARQGKKPTAAIGPLGKNLRQTLYVRLAAIGEVRAEQGTILGIFPRHAWPAADARHEAEVREAMTRALLEETAPDPRTAALISLVHALRSEHRVVDPRDAGLSKREVRERAARIARGSWASDAVRRAVDEMMAAIIAATAAASAATSATS